MKNFTNNFKQFTSRLSARWLIIALMMLVGTSSAWARTLYLKPNSDWKTDNANFAVWIWGGITNQWSELAKSLGNDYYSVEINDNATSYKWVRVSNNATAWKAKDTKWDTNKNLIWNQTGDFTVSKGNLVTITGWGTGTQSTYTPPCPTLTPGTASGPPEAICSGGSATISLSGNTSGSTIQWQQSSDNSNFTDISKATTTSYQTSNLTQTTYFRAVVTLPASGSCNPDTKNSNVVTVTIHATPTQYTVSKGSANNKVQLSDSQTNYTYTLYNGNTAVESKDGTGNSLEWAVTSTGTYTVKAKYTGSNCDEIEMLESYTYSPFPSVSTISAEVINDNLVCKGKITNMGDASAVLWAFTILTTEEISKADSDWKYPSGQNTINNIGEFTYTIPINSLNLTNGNTYYVRAMAIDKVNHGYSSGQYANAVAGEAIQFTYNAVIDQDLDFALGCSFVDGNANVYSYDAAVANGMKFTKQANGTYTLEHVFTQTTSFSDGKVGEKLRVYSSDGNCWAMAASTEFYATNNSDSSTPTSLSLVKDNTAGAYAVLTANKAYTFTLSNLTASNVELSFAENTIEEECGETLDYNLKIVCNPNGLDVNKLNLYLWDDNSTITGAWPGTPATNINGKFEWEITTSSKNIKLIFNNGNGCQTKNYTKGLSSGNQYTFTLNHTDWCNGNNRPSLNDPSVSTLSGTTYTQPAVSTVSVIATPGEGLVIISGMIEKTGCDPNAEYGYQYKLKDGASWESRVKVGEDGDAGTIFTKEDIELPAGVYEFRTYILTKYSTTPEYGEVKEVNVTIGSHNVVIAAIGGRTKVNPDDWTNFTGLYVSETGIDAVSGAKKVKSYDWQYKNGDNWTSYTNDVTETSLYNSTSLITANGANNIRPTKVGQYRCVLTYDDTNNTTQESNIITLTKETSTAAISSSERSLPVIVVRTNEVFPVCNGSSYNSAQAEHFKQKRSVDVKIFDKDGKLYYDRKARMNYRGSSSLNFVKKSYAFCPGEANCKEKDGMPDYVKTTEHNMFSLGATDKDWVLYAAAADPSLMRNRLVMDTYAQMTGEWCVKSMYVELIVDGEYKGVYVFMDKITKNANRVNITDPNGFIVKFDKTDIADRFESDGDQKTFATTRTGKKGIGTYDTTVDQLFEIEYPEKDDLEEKEAGLWATFVQTVVKEKFETFEDALANQDYPTVRSIIDYESWADWFIINEYTKNADAYRASCVFVYDGGKIEARPLWDQELSFDNKTANSVKNGEKGCNSPDGFLIKDDGVYSDAFPAPFWFTGGGANETKGLLADPCFISTIKERWGVHTQTGGALTLNALNDKITGYTTELTAKAESRERTYWSTRTRATAECKNDGGTGYNDDYDEYEKVNGQDVIKSKTNMNNWIKDGNNYRRNKLGTLIGGLKGNDVTISVEVPSETTPWEIVTVKVTSPEAYTLTGTENFVLISKSGDTYTYKIPRPSTWGKGGNGSASTQETYPVTATMSVSVDDGCGNLSSSDTKNITLKDVTENCNPEIK